MKHLEITPQELQHLIRINLKRMRWLEGRAFKTDGDYKTEEYLKEWKELEALFGKMYRAQFEDHK